MLEAPIAIAAACPDPRHSTAYAAMVLEASVRCALSGHAEDLASQAETLGYDARRLVRASGADGRQGEKYALHIAWIATAMRSHATQFDPDTTRAAAEPPSEVGEEVDDEEIVLAALIQQHPESTQIVNVLPATAFADPLRREIFEVIRTLHVSGRPVDTLTVDWEVARSRAQRGDQPPDEGFVTDDEPSYVARLAETAVVIGTPITRTAIALLENLVSDGNGQHLEADAAPPHLAAPGVAVRSDTALGQAPRLIQPPPLLPEQGHGHAQQM